MTDSHTQRLESALAGRYKIERKLGEGGMASVYLAEDLKHERKVALKILKPELAAVIGAERFLAEIKTTANLQHPHILPLFDSGEADGFLYYVMPFIDGETLRQKLDRERQLSVDESVQVARDVADALEYAHSQGVIHRDIKPANILLHRGRPVVADFGIAVAISAAGGGRMTETGLSLGTPHYMSPEQASADRDLSARSDVYSLGCVLYEMIAGQPPHTGPSAQSVLVRIMTEAPRSLTELRHTVPPHVAAVVARAVEKLPADRFQSAQEFADALDDPTFSYTSRPLSQGSRPAAPAPPPAPTGRSRLGTLLPWGVAAVLGGALLVQGLGSQGSPGTAPFPTTRTTLSLGELNLPPTERIEISAAGDRFVVAASVDGELALYVRNADEEEFRKIPGTEGATDPSFSPDGEWVAFGSEAGIMKVALAGGAPRPVVPRQRIGNPSTAWGKDGTILFRARQGLFRVSENGGEPEQILPVGWAFNARPLPGGRGVIVTNRNIGATSFVDLQRDTSWVVIPDGVDARYLESGHLLYVDQSGGLWSVPFDESEGQLTGDAVPLLGGVSVIQNYQAQYAVSETGTLVYTTGGARGMAGGGRFDLATVGIDGSINADALSPRDFLDAAWAPDGERLAYVDQAGLSREGSGATNQLYVYNAALGTTPNPLTFSGINFRPVWSPDGSRVVFASAREDSDRFDLYVKEVDTDAPPRNLGMLPGAEFPTDWLEGDTILFESAPDQASGDDLWMAVLVGEDSVVITEYLSSEADLNSLVVRPGGGWGAYSSDESGVERVYVRAFPQPRQQVAISDAGRPADSPAWSPDGTVLYYWSEADGGGRQLWAAQLNIGQAVSVIERRMVLEGPYSSYRVKGGMHPDGDRFAVRVSVENRIGESADTDSGPPASVLVVTNWFSEFRRAIGEEN